MSTTEKLIDKVKKLLALANDAGASLSEAEAALKKANKMLLQHNLTFEDVEIHKIQSDIIQTNAADITFGDIGEEGQWESALLNVLCEYNLCHCIKYRTAKVRGGSLSIIGKKQNVEIVKFLFETARHMFRDLSKQAYNDHRKHVLHQNRPQGLSESQCLKMKLMGYRMPWIRSYLKGCVIGLRHKLQDERDRLMSNEVANATNKYQLMCTNTIVAIDNFIANIPGVTQSNTALKISNDHGAFTQGVATGKNAQFNNALDGQVRPNLKQLTA